MARDDDDDAAERTDYGKKSGHQDDKGASESSGSAMHMRGGAANRDGDSGPTGSARNYPKKAPGSTHPDKTDWNPMKKPASTYGICGV
jgi:hypothetical protein